MTKKEFDEILKNIKITRQEFADTTGLTYGSVSNWNNTTKAIPKWVDSWLENYTERQKFETMKDTLRTLRASGVCNS